MSSKFVNNFKTVLFLGALTGLILFLGQLIGGTTGLVIALGIAAVSNFVAYFYSDKLALMASVEVSRILPISAAFIPSQALRYSTSRCRGGSCSSV